MKTKLISTVGPSTFSQSTIKKMNVRGLTGVRLNADFATKHELEVIKPQYHQVNPLLTTIIDTIGLKIRLFRNNPETRVKRGGLIKFSSHPEQDDVLGIDYPTLEKDICIGNRIILNGGQTILRVINKHPNYITAKAHLPALIKKGGDVFLPDTRLTNEQALSVKDQAALKTAVEQGFDFVSVSNVFSADDIRLHRNALGTAKISLLAKIENASAVQAIDEILPLVEGVIISRGDLAVETPFEDLPVYQKELSRKAAQYGKPIFFSSQLLESMKGSRYPLRAEISDIGNAIYDRVDGLILTQETAIGRYPASVIKTAWRIMTKTENTFALDPLFADDFVIEAAKQSAKNPKTLETLEKVKHAEYTMINGYKFTCQYGLDAYKTMQDFWYEFEPLVYLSKLRKSLTLYFESPDLRALRQMSILYGVKAIRL